MIRQATQATQSAGLNKEGKIIMKKEYLAPEAVVEVLNVTDTTNNTDDEVIVYKSTIG